MLSTHGRPFNSQKETYTISREIGEVSARAQADSANLTIEDVKYFVYLNKALSRPKDTHDTASQLM